MIDDFVYLASDSGFLYQLDKRSGAERWRARIDSGSPARIPAYVQAVGANDGKPCWSYDAHLPVAGDLVGVFAIDARDGKLRWKAAVPGWAWPRTTVSKQLVVAATVGAGTYPGAIRWMYLDPPSKETVEKKVEWGFGAASTRSSARPKPVADQTSD